MLLVGTFTLLDQAKSSAQCAESLLGTMAPDLQHPNFMIGEVVSLTSTGFTRMSGVSVSIRNSSVTPNVTVNKVTGLNTFPTTGAFRGTYTYSFTPGSANPILDYTFSKTDDPLLGVTSFDNFLITSHVRFLEGQPVADPFATAKRPYQLMAADVNYDFQITMADRDLNQSLILGVIAQFPSVPSWRMIATPRELFFAQISTPPNILASSPYQNGSLFSAFNSSMPVPPTVVDKQRLLISASAIGFKMGDVNFSAIPQICNNNLVAAEDREAIAASASEISAEEGETFDIIVAANREKEHLSAWESGFQFDAAAMQIVDISSPNMAGFNKESYHIKGNEGRISWYHPAGEVSTLQPEQELYRIRGIAKKEIRPGDVVFEIKPSVLPTNLYHFDGSLVDLNFSVKTQALSRDGEISLRVTSLVQDEINLQFTEEVNDSELAYQLIGQNGAIVATGTMPVTQGSARMSGTFVSQLSSGLHVLRIQVGQQVWHKKIVKL